MNRAPPPPTNKKGSKIPPPRPQIPTPKPTHQQVEETTNQYANFDGVSPSPPQNTYKEQKVELPPNKINEEQSVQAVAASTKRQKQEINDSQIQDKNFEGGSFGDFSNQRTLPESYVAPPIKKSNPPPVTNKTGKRPFGTPPPPIIKREIKRSPPKAEDISINQSIREENYNDRELSKKIDQHDEAQTNEIKSSHTLNEVKIQPSLKIQQQVPQKAAQKLILPLKGSSAQKSNKRPPVPIPPVTQPKEGRQAAQLYKSPESQAVVSGSQKANPPQQKIQKQKKSDIQIKTIDPPAKTEVSVQRLESIAHQKKVEAPVSKLPKSTIEVKNQIQRENPTKTVQSSIVAPQHSPGVSKLQERLKQLENARRQLDAQSSEQEAEEEQEEYNEDEDIELVELEEEDEQQIKIGNNQQWEQFKDEEIEQKNEISEQNHIVGQKQQVEFQQIHHQEQDQVYPQIVRQSEAAQQLKIPNQEQLQRLNEKPIIQQNKKIRVKLSTSSSPTLQKLHSLLQNFTSLKQTYISNLQNLDKLIDQHKKEQAVQIAKIEKLLLNLNKKDKQINQLYQQKLVFGRQNYQEEIIF